MGDPLSPTIPWESSLEGDELNNNLVGAVGCPCPELLVISLLIFLVLKEV